MPDATPTASKHTPGEWHCSPEADLHKIGVYAGDTIICDVTDEDLMRDGECEANAYLIAAAPDLLAALEGVVRVADRKTDEFDAARAAIAKAKGA